MRRTFFAVIGILMAAASAGSTNAPPALAATKVRVKCTVCNGRGHLKVRPPDHGQYGGRIERRSHWDIKLDPCPACERRRGWRTAWDLTQPEPTADPPCTKCGWSGIIQCRRCLASGIADCQNRECKEGWIVENPGYRRNRRTRSVKPCPDCRGVGKVLCPVCRGMRAELCNRCFGTGKKRK